VVKPRGKHAAAAGLSLAVVLASTLATLTLGAMAKQPCASGDWADGRQYRRLCYTDIVPLYATEHLRSGRFPFLDPCPPAEAAECDEYPVLTMYLMRLSASVGRGFAGFFYANAFFLAACASVIAWALHRMVGHRALWFALAPTLLIYGFVNWDLLAVALATGATLAYLRKLDGLSGALLGLGAAAKLYPGLLVVPFVLGRIHGGRRKDAVALAGWAAGAYLAVNLPIVVAAREPWLTFFRFNSERPVDWDSLWFVVCERLQAGGSCSWSVALVNLLSLLAFVGLAASIWWVKRLRDPHFPTWTFAFPLLVSFLLTNKVYSPQYGLWLLPWFALALPDFRLFAAFEAADVAVFVTRFTWFGRLSADAGDPAFAGFAGVPLGAFELAVVVRAVVLALCLVGWVLRSADERLLLDGAVAESRTAAGPPPRDVTR
jgi:uncharacterized membrane protein